MNQIDKKNSSRKMEEEWPITVKKQTAPYQSLTSEQMQQYIKDLTKPRKKWTNQHYGTNKIYER